MIIGYAVNAAYLFQEDPERGIAKNAVTNGKK